MIETGELLLADGPAGLALGSGVPVVLSAPASSDGKPIDLSVRVGDQQVLLRSFATARFGPGSQPTAPSFVATVPYAYVPRPRAWAALVGDTSVAAVDLAVSTISVALQLFRDADRDSGWDTLGSAEAGDCLVLIYECGIARFRQDATVAWHRQLWWNDRLVRTDHSSACFWSEFAEVDGETYEGYFAVDLTTGASRRAGASEAKPSPAPG